jgi:hypothetical protein
MVDAGRPIGIDYGVAMRDLTLDAAPGLTAAAVLGE